MGRNILPVTPAVKNDCPPGRLNPGSLKSKLKLSRRPPTRRTFFLFQAKAAERGQPCPPDFNFEIAAAKLRACRSNRRRPKAALKTRAVLRSSCYGGRAVALAPLFARSDRCFRFGQHACREALDIQNEPPDVGCYEEIGIHSRPAAAISGRKSRISCANTSSETCCAPSLHASAGLGCTSINSASAPMATAPLHMAATRSARPAP
jgi:hypothetical protein